jgi:hypothetical protein
MTKPRPFKIEIFVAEGVPDGLRFVEKSNWIGQGIVCPRGRWPHVKKRRDFDKSGVYILVGRDGEDDRPTLYIGEAETVRNRLNSHHANKDFWSQAIIFTTKGDPLNKAQVQYLEARLVELATEYKRCKLDNENAPNRPGLSDADRAEIEGYLDEMLSLLPVLGIQAFESVRDVAAGVNAPRTMFTLRSTGCDATGFPTNEGFAVCKGSRARLTPVPSMAVHVPSYYSRRDTMIKGELLVKDGEHYVLQADYVFPSPSQAAAIFMGRNANGPKEWKSADGKTLREHQQAEASQ